MPPVEAGEPVWRDTAAPSVVRALAPGIPAHLDRRPDVLVVGGGVVGLATAALCTRAGLGQVVLVERDTLAAAASGRAAALLTPEAHVWTDPPTFVALGRASLELVRVLDDEWGGALEVEPLDWMVALPEPIPLDARLGAKVEVLDGAAARAAEPELGEVPGALRISGQARVQPLTFAGGLASRAGTVATGIEMRGVESSRGRITTVHTSHGDFAPGAVVFATGSAPSLPGLEVRQEWVKGHLLATAPAPFRLRSALAALSGLVLQLPGGEIVAGGTLDEGDDAPVVRAGVIEAIRDGVNALVPRVRQVPTMHAWCCFRPAMADRQPVIARVPDVENAWVTCGHFRTGILMAAATGDAIARWIATGTQPPEVAAFGIDRFEGTDATTPGA